MQRNAKSQAVTGEPDQEDNNKGAAEMSERKKVLVIEDDVETAKYHAQRLYLFGFDCDLAYDGRTALEMLRTKEYELALVDIRLLGINGLELLIIIRSERIRIFAIAVSGFGEPSDRIQGLDAGADAWGFASASSRRRSKTPWWRFAGHGDKSRTSRSTGETPVVPDKPATGETPIAPVSATSNFGRSSRGGSAGGCCGS